MRTEKDDTADATATTAAEGDSSNSPSPSSTNDIATDAETIPVEEEGEEDSPGRQWPRRIAFLFLIFLILIIVCGELTWRVWSKFFGSDATRIKARIVRGSTPYGLESIEPTTPKELRDVTGSEHGACISPGQIIHNSYGAIMFRSGLA